MNSFFFLCVNLLSLLNKEVKYPSCPLVLMALTIVLDDDTDSLLVYAYNYFPPFCVWSSDSRNKFYTLVLFW